MCNLSELPERGLYLSRRRLHLHGRTRSDGQLTAFPKLHAVVLPPSISLTHSLSFFLSFYLSLSLSLSLSLALSLALARCHTHTHTLSLFFSTHIYMYCATDQTLNAGVCVAISGITRLLKSPVTTRC